MGKTTFIIRVGVTFTAEGYEQAGEILDAIDRKVAKAIAGRGTHEITGFETRPCKAQQFDQAVNQGVNMVASAYTDG